MHFTTEAERLAKRAEYVAMERRVRENCDGMSRRYVTPEEGFDRAFPPIRPVRMTPHMGWAIVRRDGELCELYGERFGHPVADIPRRFSEIVLGDRLARVELREVEE